MTLIQQLGVSFDNRLNLVKEDITSNSKERDEFRDKAQENFDTNVKAFVQSQGILIGDAQANYDAVAKTATLNLDSTKDAIINASEDGVVNTFEDFAAELQENKEEIAKKIAEDTAHHEAKILEIKTTLGPASDFVDYYGADLEVYTKDEYTTA